MTSYEPQQAPQSTAAKAPINLLRGWPHPSLLPTTILRSAAQTALTDPSISTPGLSYGPDPGYGPLRESVAKWLTEFYQPDTKSGAGGDEGVGAVTAERICITGGASQNLGCVLSVYTDPAYTRRVWVVAPAYFLAFRIFEDAGLKMRAVPEDEEGADLAYLESEIEKVELQAHDEGKHEPRFKGQRSWAKVYKHIIYCVPTFANPSSRTMTLQRRKDLVLLARKYDALVVSDDVYDFLQWPASTSFTDNTPQQPLKTSHLPRLVDLDRTLPHRKDPFGNVCSNGSLSKLAGPGLRVGWCEGTPKFAYGVSQAGTTKSGGAPSQLTSTYINILLESGELQKHIHDILLPAYSRRYTKLVGAIEKDLVPLGFALPTHNAAMKDVQGGYFTWLTLPALITSGAAGSTTSPAETLATRCLASENVVIAPGKIFEVPDHDKGISFRSSIRLCWSWEDEGKLEEGIGRIARVAQAMIEEVDKGKEEGWVAVEASEATGPGFEIGDAY